MMCRADDHKKSDWISPSSLCPSPVPVMHLSRPTQYHIHVGYVIKLAEWLHGQFHGQKGHSPLSSSRIPSLSRWGEGNSPMVCALGLD